MDKQMDNMIYSNLGKKNRYCNYLQRGDVLDTDGNFDSKTNMVIKSFCERLKKLLEVDDIYELIDEIFNMQHDDFNVEGLYFFSIFHKELSPILLRTIIDNKDSKDNFFKTNNQLIEAIRVALEEELYYWQEKMFNS